MSTKITQLNTCPGSNCGFNYMAADVSPNLTSLSSGTMTVGQYKAYGFNLIDNSNFAEVVLTNLDTSKQIVIVVNASNATVVTFDIANTVEAGQYYLRVRNYKGQSN